MTEPSSDYKIQPPEMVAKRALALAAYSCRGYLESGQGNPEAQSVQNRMIGWVAQLNLTEQLGNFEWQAIHAPLGSLPTGLASEMTWEVEGLAVLIWALQRGKIPEYDSQLDPYEVTDSVYFLGDDAAEIISHAQLRQPEELFAYREWMYAVHCRVRDFLRHGVRKNFKSWIDLRWLEILHLDPTSVMVAGDLGFHGKAIDHVELDQLQGYESGIREQHRASVWLIGEEQNHWETNADT